MQLDQVSDSQILDVCSTSFSISEALRKLDVPVGGRGSKALKTRLLDITGFETFSFKSGVEVSKNPSESEEVITTPVIPDKQLEIPVEEDPLLTVKQAAKLYGCTYANISAKIKSGALPVEIIKRKKRVRTSEILKIKKTPIKRGRPTKEAAVSMEGTKKKNLEKTPDTKKYKASRKNLREYARNCRSFLLNALSTGPQPASEILNSGKSCGFSEYKIKELCKDLGVIKEVGFGKGGELWKLPSCKGFSIPKETILPYVEYVSSYRDQFQEEIEKHEGSVEYYKSHRDAMQRLLDFLLTALK